MEHLDIIIQSIITGAIGLLLFGVMRSVGSKLDIVLKNQEDQRVIIAEIKKDVHSNQEWGRDSKIKIENHEGRINQLQIDVSALKAKQD